MEDVKLFMDHKYADLDPIVDLEHDFFTGFVPARRAEITAEEAKFYHSITEPYSVDGLLNKYYISCPAKDG